MAHVDGWHLMLAVVWGLSWGCWLFLMVLTSLRGLSFSQHGRWFPRGWKRKLPGQLRAMPVTVWHRFLHILLVKAVTGSSHTKEGIDVKKEIDVISWWGNGKITFQKNIEWEILLGPSLGNKACHSWTALLWQKIRGQFCSAWSFPAALLSVHPFT